jgi:cephalosporin hydroxylase
MTDQRPHVGERDQIHDGWDRQRPGQGARPIRAGWHRLPRAFGGGYYSFMPSIREQVKSRLSPENLRLAQSGMRMLREVYMAPRRMLWRSQIKDYPALPNDRHWRSDIPVGLHWELQRGTIGYRYRDIPMLKHPVEIALYMRLIWETKPSTIIEIGTQSGGAAVWMADMLNLFSIPGSVVSVDLKPPVPSYKPGNVQFIRGDANDIGATLTDDLLASLPRPWLVIEDSAHTFVTTLAVLRYFGDRLRSGEYIVIEDSNASEMGQADDGGPAKSIATFLRERPDFEIATGYCDHYGRNVTGNPNGYLRRK